jgi:hypothetical protein
LFRFGFAEPIFIRAATQNDNLAQGTSPFHARGVA